MELDMRLKLLLIAALAAAASPNPARAQDMGVSEDITQAQPRLPTTVLTIAGHGTRPHVFTVEQAATPQQQTTGEMFRTSIPDDGGMLFDWGVPRESDMWMRNCPIPEDMVFIGADGTIRRIAENTVPQSLAVVSSGGPVRATLELQGGITGKLDIEVGDKVSGGPFGH